jgi:hypothetical protein
MSMSDVTGLKTETLSSASDVESNLLAFQTFLQPYRLLVHLFCLSVVVNSVYEVLVTTSVTSASAARAMNKTKLIETRLRSVMSDDLYLALMLIAFEKDVVGNISSHPMLFNK